MIVVNLDVMLAKRKMKVSDLAEQVGITLANISILKNGKAKAVRRCLGLRKDSHPADVRPL